MGLGSFFRNLFGSPKVVDPKQEFIKEANTILSEPDPFEGLKIISRESVLTKDLPLPWKKETPPFNPNSGKPIELPKTKTKEFSDKLKSEIQLEVQPKIVKKRNYKKYQTTVKPKNGGDCPDND